MIYLKITKKLTREDILSKIKFFEEKYKMSLDEFEKKVVKGHEEELDEKGIYSEYEEWKYYTDAIRKKNPPAMEESVVRPLYPIKPTLEIFTEKRLKVLETLADRNPSSISQLSKLLKRDRGSVRADLEILSRENLVTLKRHGKIVKPISRVSKIEIEL